ncbi:MAG: hypothetical protein IPL90_14485 [Holophagales bacterium]|nr:hypothetical protein [Holophagales bacterium]
MRKSAFPGTGPAGPTALLVAILASAGLALAALPQLEPTVVVGGGGTGNGEALVVALKDPEGLALHPDGRLLVADRDGEWLHAIDLKAGRADAIAPVKRSRGPSESPSAHVPTFNGSQHVAVDASGVIFVTQHEGRGLLRYDPVDRTLTRIAGRWADEEFGGDGGPAAQAVIRVYGLACDAQGNVYITGANRIRRISRDTGIIQTIAGTGKLGFYGDGGPALAADLANPSAIAIDRNGTIYFSDGANNRIRAIDRKGIIRTVAGNGRSGPPEDGDATRYTSGHVVALAVDRDGDVVFVNEARFVRRLLVSRNRMETFLQSPWIGIESPREVPGVAVAKDGTILFDVPKSNLILSLPAALTRKDAR